MISVRRRPRAAGGPTRLSAGRGLASALAVTVVAGACGVSGSAPSPPSDDPVLDRGRAVWVGECARCHGAAGRGGAGPRLAGRVVERFPDPAAQREVIAEGRQGMPSFEGSLSPEEIDAVVRYTREVL